MELLTLIEQIDALLPQTQCRECGHPGCRPYAEAIASGEAINRCPPGGDKTIAALASFLQRPALPLDGVAKSPAVAFIRESECIGCTKCIAACPVDAILGAAKLMHTVIADECSGCALCVEPCPVDCIEMRPTAGATASRAAHYRRRYLARNARLLRIAEQTQAKRLARRKKIEEKTVAAPQSKLDEIREAIARAKARKAELAKQQPGNTQ